MPFLNFKKKSEHGYLPLFQFYRDNDNDGGDGGGRQCEGDVDGYSSYAADFEIYQQTTCSRTIVRSSSGSSNAVLPHGGHAADIGTSSSSLLPSPSITNGQPEELDIPINQLGEQNGDNTKEEGGDGGDEEYEVGDRDGDEDGDGGDLFGGLGGTSLPSLAHPHRDLLDNSNNNNRTNSNNNSNNAERFSFDRPFPASYISPEEELRLNKEAFAHFDEQYRKELTSGGGSDHNVAPRTDQFPLMSTGGLPNTCPATGMSLPFSTIITCLL